MYCITAQDKFGKGYFIGFDKDFEERTLFQRDFDKRVKTYRSEHEALKQLEIIKNAPHRDGITFDIEEEEMCNCK